MTLRSALLQFTTREVLLAELASAITPAVDRARFLSEASRALGTSAMESGKSAVAASPADGAALEAVRQALLPHLGLIAGVLVKRAASGIPVVEVWERVAQHIDDAAELAAFLARR